MIHGDFLGRTTRTVMTGSILIVDDDPVQRRLVEAALTKFGHTAIVTDGGEAGLDVLDRPNAR